MKSSELKQAHAQLDTCIHDSDQLKQLLAAAELLTENLRSDLGSHREEIVGKTGAIAQNEIQLAVARSDLQTSENMYQSLTSAFNGEQLKLGKSRVCTEIFDDSPVFESRPVIVNDFCRQ